jgi:hypothetical protein
MARKKKEVLANEPSGGWPTISQGQHLTVKTFEDGSTELVWDDEALLEAVREAIASVEQEEAKAKPKKTKGKKNVSTQ